MLGRIAVTTCYKKLVFDMTTHYLCQRFGMVPFMVVNDDNMLVEVGNEFHVPDDIPVCERYAGILDLDGAGGHAGLGVVALPPLLLNHAALLVDVLRVARNVRRPVVQHKKDRVDDGAAL